MPHPTDVNRPKGWYWIKLNNQPHPPWQPAHWNGKAFWIGGMAYLRGVHWTRVNVNDPFGYCEVYPEQIPEPK